jgi:AraC-like DNA-binding protein
VRASKNATKVRPKATASTAGVLHPEELARFVELRRLPASDSVALWVENHWSLHWELPDGSSYVSRTLPHPACTLSIELGSNPRPALPDGVAVAVTGVATRRFDVDVRGWGRVVGVKFRPGGLAALTARRAADWTNATVPAEEILPRGLCRTLADADLACSPSEWAHLAEAGLAELGRPGDDRYESFLDIIGDMLRDRTLTTAAQVARRHHLSLRTLQRLFMDYVGVGPKWVLARYRIHDLVSDLDAGFDGTLTELAHRYGWYDLAHLNREFKALIGVAPTQYQSVARHLD